MVCSKQQMNPTLTGSVLNKFKNKHMARKTYGFHNNIKIACWCICVPFIRTEKNMEHVGENKAQFVKSTEKHLFMPFYEE